MTKEEKTLHEGRGRENVKKWKRKNGLRRTRSREITRERIMNRTT